MELISGKIYRIRTFVALFCSSCATNLDFRTLRDLGGAIGAWYLGTHNPSLTEGIKKTFHNDLPSIDIRLVFRPAVCTAIVLVPAHRMVPVVV